MMVCLEISVLFMLNCLLIYADTGTQNTYIELVWRGIQHEPFEFQMIFFKVIFSVSSFESFFFGQEMENSTFLKGSNL